MSPRKGSISRISHHDSQTLVFISYLGRTCSQSCQAIHKSQIYDEVVEKTEHKQREEKEQELDLSSLRVVVVHLTMGIVMCSKAENN